MNTIQDLINMLQEVEDKTLPIFMEDVVDIFFASPQVYLVPVMLVHDHQHGVSYYLTEGSSLSDNPDLTSEKALMISYRNTKEVEMRSCRPTTHSYDTK